MRNSYNIGDAGKITSTSMLTHRGVWIGSRVSNKGAGHMEKGGTLPTKGTHNQKRMVNSRVLRRKNSSPVIYQDFYKSPFVSKSLISCLWGCGESVNPPKLTILEVHGRPRAHIVICMY